MKCQGPDTRPRACVGERRKFDSIGVGFSVCGSKFDSMGVTGGVPKRVRAGENPRTETKQQQEPSFLRAEGRGVRGATS